MSGEESDVPLDHHIQLAEPEGAGIKINKQVHIDKHIQSCSVTFNKTIKFRQEFSLPLHRQQ
jgi:hypothetical protein